MSQAGEIPNQTNLNNQDFKLAPDQIRVGRRIYKGRNYIDTEVPGYEPINVLAKGSEYWELSPYFLKSKDGVIMENEYQFSKVYRVSPANDDINNSYTGKVTYSQKEEIHVDEKGFLTPEYFAWRERGFKHPEWVRYPPGRKNMHLCIGAYLPGEPKLLDYVEARIKIYAKLYIEQVQEHPKYQELVNKLKAGKKLLIREVDGPIETDLQYYKDKYGVGDDFIEKNSMIANPKNIAIMLYDSKNKWGHCYALAWALLLTFGVTK